LAPDWRVASIDASAERARVVLEGPSEQTAVFFLSAPEPGAPDGPYGLGPTLTYQQGAVAAEAFHDAGVELARVLLSAADPEPVEEAVAQWLRDASSAVPTASDWKELARARLVEQPDEVLHLAELLGSEGLPKTPCVLPWFRLELNANDVVGPCCADYQVRPWRPPNRLRIGEAWHSDAMQSFRRSLASPDPSETCSSSCPHLRGGTSGASSVILQGGSEARVEAQLLRVESLLTGAAETAVAPASVQFAPTSFCNYDCLMCRCGQTGSLDDELSDAFYEDLLSHADGLESLEVCGGEPLASPRFRDFLCDLPSSPLSHVSLGMTTNGSYLTPKLIDALSELRGCDLIVSLNAASPETYERVNRGLPYARVRANLDCLLERRAEERFRGSIRYSMVILRANLGEIERFAELCRRDAVAYRFMLPQLNRNDQSIMLDKALMGEALDQLERVIAQDEGRHGESSWLRLVKGEARVLRERMAARTLSLLPRGAPDAERG